MSLTKIPFILLASWGFISSLTPPYPPSPEDERITSHVVEQTRCIRSSSVIIRAVQFFVATAEIATILASATPSWPLSKAVMSLLVWSGGKPDNLRMSNSAASGVTLMVLGAWIRLMTFRHLGRFFTFEPSILKDHELIVSGPYSVVRHPSYTGLMFVFIGWFPWQLSEGSWVIESGLWNTTLGKILVVTYIVIFILATAYFLLKRMSKEDAALRNRFGRKWDDWAKRVPYSIFPGVY